MEFFTYNDYIMCIHTLRLKSVSKLQEESEKYHLETDSRKNGQKNIHNEMIRDILKNKNEISKIINDYVLIDRKIKGNELEKCINRKYDLDENIVYKVKGKNVFFLIRHQKKKDNKVLYKMLNTSVEIIYDWNINVKIRNEIKYPVVIPIIIYTGIKKWNIFCDFRDKQVNDYRYKNCKVDFRYNLIDINTLSIEDLIQKNNLFSYALAFGKTKDYGQFEEVFNKILISCNSNKTLKTNLLNSLLKVLEKMPTDDIKTKEVIEKIINKIKLNKTIK